MKIVVADHAGNVFDNESLRLYHTQRSIEFPVQEVYCPLGVADTRLAEALTRITTHQHVSFWK